MEISFWQLVKIYATWWLVRGALAIGLLLLLWLCYGIFLVAGHYLKSFRDKRIRKKVQQKWEQLEAKK